MLGKAVLWVSAFMFTAYGLVCFFSPAIPADNAGLVISNADAFAELGAMYGGLQTGFGLFCALGALQQAHYRSALVALVICIGLLAVGRLYATVVGSGQVGFYTWAAMGYEFATALLAAAALGKR